MIVNVQKLINYVVLHSFREFLIRHWVIFIALLDDLYTRMRMSQSTKSEANPKPDRQDKPQAPAPALLFEMARSFVTLAETLNLTHAVEKLNSTRQTLRRHIANLEDSIGAPLFVVEDRRYQLTDTGRQALAPAQSIIAHGETWHRGDFFALEGLNQLSYVEPSGFFYHQLQQPLRTVWEGNSTLLKAAVKAWALSSGALEHDSMQHLRPYMLVYRETELGWMCVEVGEKSFYTNWWGWTKARSSVAKTLEKFNGGPEVANLMEVPYQEVKASHGLRLDQVVSIAPRGESGEFKTIAFQRLLLGGYLSDGSFALLVVVDRPDTLSISGVDPEILDQVPEDAKVNYEENETT